MMQCPICKSDLTPLDVGSRIEHVDFCLENGPSTLEVNEEGRMIMKKVVDPKKQRKICPICDKTFQQLNLHFKKCALKNDVPPDLMLDYWDRINKDSKVSKKFPRELLKDFVNKCIKEGRDGDQVDFARALYISMSDGKDEPPEVTLIDENSLSDPTSSGGASEAPSSSETSSSNSNLMNNSKTTNANQLLMQNATNKPQPKAKSQPKKFRLQLVDDTTKQSNIELRIDRELAASRSKRYRDTIAVSKSFVLRDPCNNDNQDDDDCLILIQESQESYETSDEDLSKLFYRARLKSCDGSIACSKYECSDHDVNLLLVEFKNYTGPTIDAESKRTDMLPDASNPAEF